MDRCERINGGWYEADCSFKYEPAADLILITHSHHDHNGVERIENRNPDCQIITWEEALSDGEHQTFDLGYAKVEAVEAGYNRWHDVKECVCYIATLSDGVYFDRERAERFEAENRLIVGEGEEIELTR